jgi:hypothetical protein
MTRHRILGVAAAGLVAVTGLAGCGVGGESSPREIDRRDVPFGLAERADAPTTTHDRDPYSFTIYLVTGDRLRAVARGSQADPAPAARLRELLDGPTPAEADDGLRTLLTPAVAIESVRVADRMATIALSDASAAQPSGNEGALAVAQLVYTATAIPGVDRVRFVVDGTRTEIPRGDGTLTDRPVGRDDYGFAAP